MKKHLVVFTGSGVSAESGIKTFRDAGGLWEEHKVEDVATPEAWRRNPTLVQNFYNQRRKELLATEPNEAHKLIANLENCYSISVITQNIDDLHERAGSSKVLHLHGELLKSRSSLNSNLIYPIYGWELKMGEKCEQGSQLRPFIVWFGEDVPNMTPAMEIAAQADIFCVIGTSLAVYPAANLLYFVPKGIDIYLIDPNPPEVVPNNVKIISDVATKGVAKFINILKEKY